MHLLSRKQAFASVMALALAAGSGAALADATSQAVTDARHETRISTSYAFHPELNGEGIEVAVASGKATLTGEVSDEIISELAKQVALQVDGVTEVDNQLVVGDEGSTTGAPATGRSFGTIIDDATITTVVKSKLMWSKYTEGLATEVSTESGRVTLEGVADSEAASNHAERLASNTRGTVSVDNRLVVDPAHKTLMEKATTVAEGTGQDIADGWITTKVKSTLLYSSNVSGTGISVRTDNDGVVTLSGKVSGEAEKALAIALAENVRGVRSVLSDDLVF